MKRTAALILAILFLLPCLCCGKAPSGEQNAEQATEASTAAPKPGGDFSYDPETDFDKRISAESGRDCFIEAEDVYYWFNDYDHFIRYCEKSGGCWDVLCPKPECVHDAGNGNRVNGSCSGYVGNPSAFIWMHEGRLYYVDWYRKSADSPGRLFSIAPDGTDRRAECDLPVVLSEDGKPIPNGSFWFHRGLIYMNVSTEDVINTEPVYRFAIAVCPLDGSDVRVIYRPDQSVDMFHYIKLNFAGEYCYIFDSHGNGSTISRWSSVTGETELIYDDTELFWVMYGWISEEGELFVHSGPKVYKIENGGLTEVISFDDPDKGWHVITVSDGVAIARNNVEYSRDGMDTDIDLWVKSYDGRDIYKGKLPMDWLGDVDRRATLESIAFACGTENELIMEFVLRIRNARRTNEPVIHALVKYELNGGSINCITLGVQSTQAGVFDDL